MGAGSCALLLDAVIDNGDAVVNGPCCGCFFKDIPSYLSAVVAGEVGGDSGLCRGSRFSLSRPFDKLRCIIVLDLESF